MESRFQKCIEEDAGAVSAQETVGWRYVQVSCSTESDRTWRWNAISATGCNVRDCRRHVGSL